MSYEEPPSKYDFDREDAIAKARDATHGQIVALLETMGSEERETLAFRLMDIAATYRKPTLLGYYANALNEFIGGLL